MPTDQQIKSKQRATDHGEVFTNPREVNAMLDLVKHETERIDSRFLEPACGTGNFLIEVLRRKSVVIQERYRQSQIEYERYTVLAVGSIYGIDLLADNVTECRARLFNEVAATYRQRFRSKAKEQFLETINYILTRNIQIGDALTLQTPDNNKPIIFSEWTLVRGSQFKRRDYTMANLLASQPINAPNLFSDLGDRAFIPKPIADYPLTHLLKLPHVQN